MHGVNLDLLQTTAHHADGRARDPHAHHRAAHLDALRAARRARRQAAIQSLLDVLPLRLAKPHPRVLAQPPRA